MQANREGDRIVLLAVLARNVRIYCQGPRYSFGQGLVTQFMSELLTDNMQCRPDEWNQMSFNEIIAKAFSQKHNQNKQNDHEKREISHVRSYRKNGQEFR